MKNWEKIGLEKIEAGIKQLRDDYSYIVIEEKNKDVSVYIEKNGLIKFVTGFVFNQKMYEGNSEEFYSDIDTYINSTSVQEENINSLEYFCERLESTINLEAM